MRLTSSSLPCPLPVCLFFAFVGLASHLTGLLWAVNSWLVWFPELIPAAAFLLVIGAVVTWRGPAVTRAACLSPVSASLCQPGAPCRLRPDLPASFPSTPAETPLPQALCAICASPLFPPRIFAFYLLRNKRQNPQPTFNKSVTGQGK